VRAGDARTTVALEASALAALPAGLEIVWLDLEQGSRVACRGPEGLEPYTVQVAGGERPYRLRLLAGTHDWVEQESANTTVVPAHFTVQQNAPNPFNGGTRFRFGLPLAASVRLDIFDVHGRRIATLADGLQLPAGWHTLLWDGAAGDGKPAASGVYFFRLRAGDQSATKRMVLLK